VPIAVRRRRVLLSLVALTGLGLVLGLTGFVWGFGLFAVFAFLAAAYVVHLRRQAIRKAELALRRAGRPSLPRSAAARAPMRVAGVPDRMPARPQPLTAPLPAPAARYEDPQPAGSTWDAVEFPVPTYVTAPAAPPRPPRVLDLTRPGEWSAGAEGEDVGLAILDEDDELDDILDGRRASGDW
jgi:hypothetical protein